MRKEYFLFEDLIPISDIQHWSEITETFDEMFGYSYFGDIFLLNSKTKQCAILYTMPPELAEIDFYGIDEFVNEFLSHDIVKEDLLKIEKVTEIEKKIGALKNGEVFIPEPYLFAGGDGSVDSYSKGDIWVFLEIIGNLQSNPISG